ncbi:MAG: MFS transporter, partial [Chloroflexota bacterium]|nr:MFS transporter [Chloroflexota bacterium]
IPLDLFRSREFTVINLSTFLIYGALYVTFTFQAVFLQGTLGYTALAAGLLGVPIGLLLTLLSTRVGSLAGRIGPRPFLVAGPILMAMGLAWQVRIPATSTAWQASPGDIATLMPPTDFLVDILPSLLLFGVGISLVVAPLTTALMDSIPSRNAGIGSAFNNAVSRVGQPLMTALLFIAITTTFYGAVSSAIPRLDFDSAEVRRDVAPLNTPVAELSQEEATAVRDASTGAYRSAMLGSVALLLAGALVNAVGIRRRGPATGGGLGPAVAGSPPE